MRLAVTGWGSHRPRPGGGVCICILTECQWRVSRGCASPRVAPADAAVPGRPEGAVLGRGPDLIGTSSCRDSEGPAGPQAVTRGCSVPPGGQSDADALARPESHSHMDFRDSEGPGTLSGAEAQRGTLSRHRSWRARPRATSSARPTARSLRVASP